ncbi:MAG TPA: SAM-dependent methyltransferase, partial [Candidatus Thermoplasmatota archaeon]|nr:SAM-dependent methyltransferase [Candidatus Thermoplasmatota archaeon]
VKEAGMPRVVELGAGTGELARDLLARGLGVEYVTVDASPALRARQEAAGATAYAALDDVPAGPALVFGNEVLDALPVRRIVGGPAGALEVHVDVAADGRFRDRLLPAPDAPFVPQRGQICDVAPALEPFVRAAARIADPGYLVLIDYGDVAERLYAPTRLNGTLVAYRAHEQNQDWYARPGEQDLTADVDWSAVARAATDAGMEMLGLVTQQRFLEALGVDEMELVSPARLGSAFQVAAFRRGVARALPGFSP